LAGQGTMALEIIDQVPDVDAIIVPTGGAGLLAGIAVAAKELKPNILIIVFILFFIIASVIININRLCFF
jgi:threonine dehydratase